ncbi:MAG TPA: phosphatase PAP2 family protein [Candidatus Hydrogenedentes bacterium]|nr:phosphatase PAP2 family protein [Candidatus Hydrogenedentota bacterium]HOH42074.1 phosphatase PAP2 family protein [Candidatus Hydrogenedentota bacterium]HOR51671.1 phosphatase PAP2 family protein [Candidatus Hydrogenedentota bacterium]HPK25879.1 phosphatase PAP2 family protein [Candidatus Hydrogenedentota bacterium]
MMLKDNTAVSYARAWALFLVSYAVFFGITLFMGKFIEADWDIRLLLFMNPDHYVPILDQLVIFQTDWGAFYMGLLTIAWLVGYYASRSSAEAQTRTKYVYYVLAVLFGLWYGAGMFVQKKGIFWWGKAEYTSVFLLLGLVLFGGLMMIGTLFTRLSDDDQRKITQACWLVLLCVFFVNAVGEDTIKALIKRPRPLHEANNAWNGAIRVLPDEVVKGSYSYISGHTSSFWAQTVVFFWLIKSWRIRIPLLALGIFHGYTRIYTTAHFPYCVIMATFFGFGVSSMVYYCFWNHRHLPLLAMLSVGASLLMVAKASQRPVALGVIVISLVWFAVWHLINRGNAPAPAVSDALYPFGEPEKRKKISA